MPDKKKRFVVKEQMLEVLDDHSRGEPAFEKKEADHLLQEYFPKLTSEQRKVVLRKWKRQMDEALGW